MRVSQRWWPKSIIHKVKFLIVGCDLWTRTLFSKYSIGSIFASWKFISSFSVFVCETPWNFKCRYEPIQIVISQFFISLDSGSNLHSNLNPANFEINVNKITNKSFWTILKEHDFYLSTPPDWMMIIYQKWKLCLNKIYVNIYEFLIYFKFDFRAKEIWKIRAVLDILDNKECWIL